MNRVYPIKQIRCPKCAEQLVANLKKLEFIKAVQMHYDEKEIEIDSQRPLSDHEVELILDSVLALSHCHDHTIIINDQANREIEKTEEFIFSNIDCPNCALKVERALNKDEHIVSASVNFMNKKIVVTHHHDDSILPTIQSIVGKVEAGASVFQPAQTKESHPIKCACGQEHHHEEGKVHEKLTIPAILFLVGMVFFIVSVLLKLFVKPEWLSVITFGVAYLGIGYDIVWKSIRNIGHGQLFDENFLMIVASAGAMMIGDPVEGFLVILLYRVGEYFQNRAVQKSTNAIQSLMEIKVDQATLADGRVVSVKDIEVDDILIVKVGEQIPVDGILIEGETELDMKMLTGESLPVSVRVGETILSGCVNLTTAVKVKATKRDAESTLSKVLKLVDEASNKKSTTEQFITKFARIYTPIVLSLALVLFFVQFFAFHIALSKSLESAFSFLIIACPCALVISIPLGFFGGIGRASQKGILVKGGNYLEALTQVDQIVFDKTGTITEGNFKVSKINVFAEFTEEDLLRLLAHMEFYSNHPIARSIQEAYPDVEEEYDVKDLQEISGYGLKGEYLGKTALVGKAALMQQYQIDYVEETCPGTVIYAAYDHIFVGSIVITDQIKAGAKALMDDLKHQGIKTVMLTGDKANVAKLVAEAVGIDHVEAELLPDQKLQYLEDMIQKKTKKHTIVYVGDGINDTPSIKMADVGIAMGGMGSDAAKESADIVIMNDDIQKISDAIAISKLTRRTVIQNIVLALVVKVLALIISAWGILGSYSLLLSVFADVGVSIIAVIHTMRILRKKHIRKIKKQR